MIGKFFSYIFAEAKAISRILSCNVPMAALTAAIKWFLTAFETLNLLSYLLLTYIVEEMLSDTLHLMQDVIGIAHFPCTKLVSNLRDKSRYVTHYRCLQFYLAQGLVLDKIHRLSLIHI